MNRKSTVRHSYGTDLFESNNPTIREEDSSDVRNSDDVIQQESRPNNNRYNKEVALAHMPVEDSYGITIDHNQYQPEPINNNNKKLNNYLSDSKPDDSISYSITNNQFEKSRPHLNSNKKNNLKPNTTERTDYHRASKNNQNQKTYKSTSGGFMGSQVKINNDREK